MNLSFKGLIMVVPSQCEEMPIIVSWSDKVLAIAHLWSAFLFLAIWFVWLLDIAFKEQQNSCWSIVLDYVYERIVGLSLPETLYCHYALYKDWHTESHIVLAVLSNLSYCFKDSQSLQQILICTTQMDSGAFLTVSLSQIFKMHCTSELYSTS